MKKIYLIVLVLFCALQMNAQTSLITASDGGFEGAVPTGTPGTDFTANGWTVINGASNRFFVGPTAIPSAGTYSAFTGTSAVSWTGQAAATISHIYRDITIPPGDNFVTISFKYKVSATDPTFDFLKVYLLPTTTTPVAGTALVGNIGGTYDGSTGYANYTITAPVTGGATQRLIFSFKSDGVAPNAAASIDEITAVSSITAPAVVSPVVASTAIGGLWSSPATWVGGVVPGPADKAVISDGAIVTVDQVVGVNELTVGGGTSGTLLWNGTANGMNVYKDVLVNPGANLNMFTAAASPNGVSINIGGSFTNNGTVHAAYVNAAHAYLNFSNAGASSTLGGTGTFVGGIISQLFFQTTGSNVISTTQNLKVRAFAHTAGSLNTNGKLSVDNTAQVFGQPFNQQVYEVAVTAMGSGYNSATPPTVTIAAPTGAGITATATPNIDDITGTLRSITITSAGDGYRANPAVTIAGGTGTGATATAVVNLLCIGNANSLIQKSGAATITGGLNIKSDQAVGGITTANAGLGYTSAPSVGFALPTGYLNLVTAGGSGYTSLPTITVSGGTSLAGSTNPTFNVVVAQGKVVSVIPSAGGTLWTSPPTLTITGGGGAGATCAYPLNCLATATASINNGAVSDFTVTNAGFGYTAAPAVGLVGGGFATASIAPTCRIGLYNLTMGYFAPAPANAVHTEAGMIPANRRINVITMNSALGASLTGGNIEVYNAAPLTFTNGIIDMGSNTLSASHPSYAGVTGSATAGVKGAVSLTTPGGSLTRTFPLDAPVAVVLGSGSLATGSTVTTLTVKQTAAASGAVTPAGSITGTRAYRITANAGAVYGTTPTVTLNYNSTDALVSLNPNLFIGQSAALTGPWTTVSTATGSGALGATGSRTTATAAPGPIVPAGDDYFAWISTFVPVTSAASGDWNDPLTWTGGVVPGCASDVQILNSHNVTVTTAGNSSKTLSVNSGGTLTVNSGDLTIGCTQNNSSLVDNGTISVSNGTLKINGNFQVNNTANLIQSGGLISIDGNNAGATATSVAAGTPLFGIGTAATNYSTGNINLTGGTLMIVDPHAGTTATTGQAMTYYGAATPANNITTGVNHIFQLGDGVSTDAGGHTSGFFFNQWEINGGFKPNLVINTAPGTNRNVTSVYSPFSVQDLIIQQGSFTAPALTNVERNLTVASGGTLTVTGTIQLATGTFSGTSLVASASTVPQAITGGGVIRNLAASPTANLTSLTVFNTSAGGVTLNTPISLSGTLTMTDGLINSVSPNLLTLGTTAASAGTFTYTAGRIAGSFKRWVTTASASVQFPMGTSADLKNALINYTSPVTTGGSLTARWSPTAPGFPNASVLTEGSLTVDATSTQGSWFIDAADGLTGGTYTATFTANGSTDIVDYTKTVLLKRPSSGGDWLLDGTHVTTTGSNSAPVLSRTGMSGFSEFAIGGQALVVVPVSTEYFRGSKLAAANYLTWKVNCSGPSVDLTLERSGDARSFKGIDQQNATAARCLQEFNYTDRSPLSGINYYRLKITAPDGSFRYTNIVALINKDKGFELISVAPNPVQSQTTLTISTVKGGTMMIAVTDMNGKMMMQQNVTVIGGSNAVNLNFSKLAAGTYRIIAIDAEGEKQTTGFVKY